MQFAVKWCSLKNKKPFSFCRWAQRKRKTIGHLVRILMQVRRRWLEWIGMATLQREVRTDTALHYGGRFLLNVGVKTTKYLRAEGVDHVKRECSFCVEERANAMIQKAAKPLTLSNSGQFLSVFIFLLLCCFFPLSLSLSPSVICLYTIMAAAVCKSYIITFWMPSA